MVFGYFPHKETCDTLSEYMVSYRLQDNSSTNEEVVLRYVKKVKCRHGIGIPTTCVYQNYGDKTDFNVRAMFYQSYFSLPVLHNILHHFFAWTFYNFTCFPINEGYILRITNYGYDKYFSISAHGKSGGSRDEKVKVKYQKKKKVKWC